MDEKMKKMAEDIMNLNSAMVEDLGENATNDLLSSMRMEYLGNIVFSMLDVLKKNKLITDADMTEAMENCEKRKKEAKDFLTKLDKGA